mgnify:CR=1 FL=1
MAEAARTRRIDDAGEKIEGARKDWKSAAMTSADLAAMTDEEIALSVRKDHVWPKPDYAAMIAGGMEPEAAALVKIIRDRMAQEPRDYRNVDPIAIRREFVSMVTLVRDRLLACRTAEDVKGVYSAVQQAVGGDFRATAETRMGYMSVFKGRECPFALRWGDLGKARKMVAEGFPESQPAWRKGVTVRHVPDQDGGSFWVARNGRILKDGFETEEAAWKWAEESWSSRPKQAQGDGKAEPKRPHLDAVARNGMSFSLGGRDVSPEDFIETFGFRGVQFGNWLPDDERQRVLNMGYEALMDLAEVLGWEPKALSLGGDLAVAFGARGKGGKAAAHYEPGQRVVNMTRMSGAGTLAHEFAHALDHWAGRGTPLPCKVPSATGWHDHLPDRKAALAHRSEATREAWESVWKAMTRSPVDKEGALDVLDERLARLEEAVAANRHGIDRQLGMEERLRNGSYLRKALKWEADRLREIEALKARMDQVAASERADHGETASFYLKEAAKLSGGSDYWRRPTELFARAFEAWVEDEVAARGGRSQYLVHGAAEGLFAGDEFKGDPYPSGKERQRIGAAMAALALSMKPEAELEMEREASPAP